MESVVILIDVGPWDDGKILEINAEGLIGGIAVLEKIQISAIDPGKIDFGEDDGVVDCDFPAFAAIELETCLERRCVGEAHVP